MSQRKDTGLNTNPWPKLVDHYNDSDNSDVVLDEYLGEWTSSCKNESDTYYMNEYIFSSSVIKSNLYTYDDLNCLNRTRKILGDDKKYYEYTNIITHSGYKARWYISWVQPVDSKLAPIKRELGFYVEGDTLYRVDKLENNDGYSVDFNTHYSRKQT